jgi:polysaccharide pyruvyl transferase WcaK-like protein
VPLHAIMTDGPHLALISPYDAGNLGDAAILESVSGALRALDPGCRFTAVTLAPLAMPDYHGLPGRPITGASLEFYAISTSEGSSSADGEAAPVDPPESAQRPVSESPRRAGLMSRLGRLPLIGPLLKRLRDVARFAIADLRHWRESHAWLADVNCVMVAGGGQFDDEWGGAWGHPYALFKWSVLARMRRLPFVVASVGVCRTEDRLARYFFARAMRNASLLTFRDADSKDRALAIESRCPGKLVPDLAFALNPAVPAGVSRAPAAAARRLRVGVSPIAYRMPGAWPIPDAARFEEYMNVLLELVARLRAAGHEVILFTSERTDRDVVHRVRQHFDAAGGPPLECALPDRLHELLGALNSFDVIVTSRLHGVILSHVLGKPAAALSYDRKVRAHMQDMEQERFCIDIDSPGLQDAWPMVQRLIAERELAANGVQSALAPRKALVMDQYARIVTLAKSVTSH